MGQEIVSIKFTIHLPAVVIKKQKWYVSHCPVLDVSSQGDTEEEAKRNLIEAISLFMITCHEMGTLDKVLKDCGFVPDYSGNVNRKLTTCDNLILTTPERYLNFEMARVNHPTPSLSRKA